MYIDNKILMGRGTEYVYLLPKMANRHGLIAGATGTGKTVTLKVMAESFSEMGVPVFLADIKGDVSGMCKSGSTNESLEKRLAKLGIENFEYHSFPTEFWDVFGEYGIPVRTTISEMGPELLGRLMELTEVQCGVLNIVFRVADDNGMYLIDLKDLRSMLAYVGKHSREYTTTYGTVSPQSVGAIQRALLRLEDQGAEKFFGEPDLEINDWLRRDNHGRGYINILHCVELFQKPMLYSTFMLWMLTKLYETLPEVGDLDKPKVVFFFDEAHLLFADSRKALLDKIVQVVKLIRSKGVGVYFITQNPTDIPDPVLAQLGNKVQHALRAYTPSELKVVKAAAQSFRTNPDFDTETVLTELGTGEALVSFLDADGRPSMTQRAKILPPQSYMSTIDEDRRNAIIESSDLYSRYYKSVDRRSAYEIITEETEKENYQLEVAKKKELEQKAKLEAEKEAERKAKAKKTSSSSSKKTTTRKKKSSFEKAVDSGMNTIGRELGKSIVRTILGVLKNK